MLYGTFRGWLASVNPSLTRITCNFAVLPYATSIYEMTARDQLEAHIARALPCLFLFPPSVSCMYTCERCTICSSQFSGVFFPEMLLNCLHGNNYMFKFKPSSSHRGLHRRWFLVACLEISTVFLGISLWRYAYESALVRQTRLLL